MNWEEKLEKFLEDWEHKNDLIGILVCGSFITGNPTSHSDLDVHLILDEKVDYRVRGNKIVEGLLIEYFANTPNQIREYFKEDYKDISLMSQNQFVTGKIISDDTDEVKKLKKEASKMLNSDFKDIDMSLSGLDKYGLWDKLDDLQDIYKGGREDFDFIYYNNLNALINTYMNLIKMPYNKKTILGHVIDPVVRNKYLLKELDNEEVKEIIIRCITSVDRKERLKNYEKLTNVVLDMSGGFNIDGFYFKSDKEV